MAWHYRSKSYHIGMYIFCLALTGLLCAFDFYGLQDLHFLAPLLYVPLMIYTCQYQYRAVALQIACFAEIMVIIFLTGGVFPAALIMELFLMLLVVAIVAYNFRQGRFLMKYMNIFLKMVPEAAVFVDNNGAICCANDKILALSKHARPDLLGMNIEDFAMKLYGAQIPSFTSLAFKYVEATASHFHASVNADGTISGHAIVVQNEQNIHLECKTGLIIDPRGQVLGAITTLKDISVQAEAERRLRLSEALYRSVVDSQDEIICRMQPDTQINFVNGSLCQYFHVDSGDMLGISIYELLAPDQQATVSQWLGRLCQDHPKDTYTVMHVFDRDQTRHLEMHEATSPIAENIIRRRDSHSLHLTWVEYSIACLLDLDGRILQYQIVGRDVSRQVWAEIGKVQALRALQHSEQLHRLIAENVQDVIVRHNAMGTISYITPSCYRVFGYQTEEMIGHRANDFILSDDLKRVQDEVMDYYRRGQNYFLLEHRIIAKDRRAMWVETYGSIIRDENGRMIEIQSSIRDVTARKQAEEARNKAEFALRLTQFSMDQSPEGIYWINPEGKIVYVNEAVLKQLGYTRDEMLTMGIFDVNPPASLESWASVKNQIAREGFYSAETIHRTRDGSLIYVEILLTCLRFEGQTYYMGYARDISKRRQAEMDAEIEKKRRGEYEQRIQKVATLSAMSAGLVHEISQPLNAMSISIESFYYFQPMDDARQMERMLHTMNNVRLECERIVAIVDHMRVLAGAGYRQPEGQCDINTAIKYSLQFCRVQIESHGINLQIELADDPLIVNGDLTALEQIIINLITNARQELDQLDGKERIIELRSFRFNDAAVLEVSDNGRGIPLEYKEVIFEPFFTTKESRGGLGIGLSIVQSIVTRLQGHILITNSADCGTCFRVELPLAHDISTIQPVCSDEL